MTWVEGSGPGVELLPFGVFSVDGGRRRLGVAIRDRVLDVAASASGDVRALTAGLSAPTLDSLLAAGPAAWRAVREWLTERLSDERHREAVVPHLFSRDDVTLHLPFTVADYVDFYSSEHHASNVGRIFRPDAPPLLPNWKELPVGYHGRSGTVVVSGTPIVRPCGQRKAPGDDRPTYGPSLRLDIEAEVAFVVGARSVLGTRVPVEAYREHVFGLVLLNDWSARDLQAWEYVPLGPFLGKSFATSISPWVIPLAALDEARCAPPLRDPEPLAYLRDAGDEGLDLALEVTWNGTVVSRPPFSTMYWTAAQQLAHLTVNGAALRTGDLYASGTVSGPAPEQRGSFLELSWNGRDTVTLDDGSTRTFLEDGDTVVISASAPGPGGTRLDLGAVAGTVLPARQ